MPLNVSAVLGISGGVALLLVTIAVTAANPINFLNLPGALIVVGGTIAASLVTYSFADLRRAVGRFIMLLKREHIAGTEDIDQLVRVAGLMLSGKVKAIEDEIHRAHSPFVKTGLQLLVDGMPPDDIGNVLELRMKRQEEIEHNDAAVFKMMATYTPAFGMAATLIGLVNMLRLMGVGATPQQVGLNMGLALVATFYGLVLANAILRPIATKIEKKTQDRMRFMAAIVEALRCIGEGRGPGHVREILYAIASSPDNELGRRDTLPPTADKDLYGNLGRPAT